MAVSRKTKGIRKNILTKLDEIKNPLCQGHEGQVEA